MQPPRRPGPRACPGVNFRRTRPLPLESFFSPDESLELLCELEQEPIQLCLVTFCSEKAARRHVMLDRPIAWKCLISHNRIFLRRTACG